MQSELLTVIPNERHGVCVTHSIGVIIPHSSLLQQCKLKRNLIKIDDISLIYDYEVL